jgi:FAD/FMN-containing dehydrogenase
MRRRTFLQSGAAAAAVSLALRPVSVIAKRLPNWAALRSKVGDKLIDIRSPLVECARNHGAGADALFAKLKNPYYLSDEPSLTQTLGWIDAWTSRPSLKGVAATSAADIAAAIDFARSSGIPPVVKGGGHSYFGNSNRAGSLLIWTHRMRQIELHDAFRPLGATAIGTGVPAVSVGAGCLWGEVYRKVSVEGGRYVQGGGCMTVGVGGLVLGGGFGSLSKQFGTGAASLLEAEIVTADGRVRIVNRLRDPDLFFALRGGGGGTFGVVTRLTLKTHPLPATIGAMFFDVTAADESAWRELVARIIDFYATALFNPNWGEQIAFTPGRRISVTMVCHSLTQPEIERAWAPFTDWLKSRPQSFKISGGPVAISVPGRGFWDPETLRKMPGIALQDSRRGSPSTNVFWKSNLGEAGQVLHAYQSAWLPSRLLAPRQRAKLVDALIRSSAIWTVSLHTNKGLAGGSPEAIEATRQTAMNPEVLDAFALLICAAEEQPAYPGIPGHEPDVAAGRHAAAGVSAAMREIYAIVPNAGAYLSESDYFQRSWKQAYWGEHYTRLARTKRKYDPQWIFRGRNCVEPDLSGFRPQQT